MYIHYNNTKTVHTVTIIYLYTTYWHVSYMQDENRNIVRRAEVMPAGGKIGRILTLYPLYIDVFSRQVEVVRL